MRPACVPGKQRLQPAGWHSPQLVLRRHRQAAATGPPLPEPELPELQEEAQPEAAFDIVSRNRLTQAEGTSCTWPRPEQRKRWEDAALMTTGFPVPAGYGGASRQPATGSGMLWALRNPARQPRAGVAATAAAAAVAARQASAAPGQRSSAGAEEEDVMPAYATPVVPVFRAAPYSAEAARQRRPSTTARILLLDDGCTCRAPLAAALLQSMLRKLPRPLDVEVLAASIGPPVPGPHDERVAQMAREMAIPLPPRRPPPREFDEMRDTVDCDLILVMDRYDRQEVEREVSVLERLNPGGAYLTRVRRLGEFARVGQVVHRDRCLLVPDDVPDPFYGTVNDAAEQASLRQTVHTLALCCRGLVAYLLKLRARSGTAAAAAAVPLRLAVAQSLQCPLMDPTSHHAVSALIHCQLGPAKLALWQQQGKGGQDSEGSAAGTRRWRSRVKPGGGAGTPVRHAGDWSAHVSGWPRPVWVEASANDSGDEDSSDDRRPLWTVREVAGQTVVVRRARRGVAAARPGYWANVENVEGELRKWMEAAGLTDRLPSQQELRASGANTLSAMVGSHGGLALFARRMGLQLASGRAANGHWANFEHLAAELRRFVQDRHAAPAPAAAPTPPVAGAAGAATSVAAQQQQQQGEPAPPLQRQQQAQIGQAAAAGRSVGRRRPPRFASRSWSSGGSGLDAEPGAVKVKLLASGGKASHTSGSSGTDATSTRTSTSNDSKQSGSKDGNTSSSSSGGGGGGGGTPSSLLFMPTQQELRSAGRTDLIGGIRQQGGSLAVAARLGWGVRHGRLPSETAVVAQLLDFVEQEGEQAWRRRRRGGPGAGDASGVLLGMPTLRELEESGRADLASAVVRLGGVQVFAHMLEREQQRRQRRKRRSSMEEGEGAAAEPAPAPPGAVPAGKAPAIAADAFGTRPPPPPPPQQQQQSSHILTYPYGVASGSGRRPPPPSQPQPAIVRVGASVVQLIEARGWDRRVPTKQELVAAGRRDLHAAITRCGGGQKLAEHLQLPYAETRGRRKRCEVERPSPQQQQQQQQLELQGSFLAARLRPPPGCAEDVGAKLAAAGGGGAGARAAYAQQRAGIPSAQQRKGPASRLLEKELVLEAYEDVTFV